MPSTPYTFGDDDDVIGISSAGGHPVNATIEYLNGLVPNLRPSSRGGYKGKCPAHAGRSDNSLKIGSTDTGGIWVKCWAGCSQADVADALGLTLRELRSTPPPPDLIWPEAPELPGGLHHWDLARATGHLFLVQGEDGGRLVRLALPGAAVAVVPRPWAGRRSPGWGEETCDLHVWMVTDNTAAGRLVRRCVGMAVAPYAETIHDVIGMGRDTVHWHWTVGSVRFKSQLIQRIARGGVV